MKKTAWCDDVGDKGHARQLRSIAEADVSDRPDSTASQVYGLGQLQRAMARAARPTEADLGPVPEEVRRWLDALDRIDEGRLQIGSRTPVADSRPGSP